MAGAFAQITRFTRRRAVALWLLCMALAAVVTLRTNYVADLSAFLPSTPSAEQAVLLDQLKSGVAARLVLIGIEGGTAEQRSAASLQFGQALRRSGAFDAVHNGDNSGFEETGKFLFAHRYLLSPAVDAERFTVEGLRAGIDEATSLLGTPAGAAIKSVILRDPTGETIRMAEGMLPSQAPRSDGRVWVSRSAARAVLIATTRADGADLDAQERTLQLIDAGFAPFKAQGLSLMVSGSGTFAVASRAQIKSEVERLAIAGGVAIVALLLLAFGGSLRTLVVAMLPVASGVLVGIAAVSLIFGNVHGITLGFGTTLIGEAVDYAIYYLIQARPAAQASASAGSGARRWITANWPTVRLGLWTSLCGFAALLFSGFPGLAQLGVFSIAGLAAAALTTRWVLTRTSPDGEAG
ncbi:MAG: transporter, partial [Rhizobiales bacterium]|nr:transporter [Rhizobacter sp.]